MASDYSAISIYNEEQLGKDRKSRMSQVAMYADTAHFVYEILQNADDVGATQIRFTLNMLQLIIEHDGGMFTEPDVWAISYFGMGKTDITKIGHFGLGFKSVFAYTASPRVHSGKESFEITSLYTVASVLYPRDLKPTRTRFVLPFDHDEKPPDYIERGKHKSAADAYAEIEEKLSNLGAETLLFTRSLREICWKTEEEEGHYLREDKQQRNSTEIYIVASGGEERCFLTFSQQIFWPDEAEVERERRPVQITFELDKQLASGGRIIEVKKPKLFVFFPTEKETHVGFMLQGPYRTTPARDNVPDGDDFNKYLVHQSGELLAECLLQLKTLELLDLNVLNLLPIDHDFFPKGSLFGRLFYKVRETLRKEAILPTARGGFVSGERAKLARGAWLIEAFRLPQLAQLFKTPDLKWLSQDLTKDNYPTLYGFLVGKKSRVASRSQMAEWTLCSLVPDIEVDAEIIAKKITVEFMNQQPDQWLVHFYISMGKARGDIYQSHFKDCPLIRLEDDMHVVAFDRDGSPNAFLPLDENGIESNAVICLPLVKRALVQNKKAWEFLENDLKLTKPDMADLVLREILPKYAPDNEDEILVEIWQQDFKQISLALQTDSYDTRQRLVDALKKANFVLAISTDSMDVEKGLCFVTPGDAYINNEETRSFFSGYDQTYLLALDYYDENLKILYELGMRESPRTDVRQVDNDGHVNLTSSHGWHKRGLDGFDPAWTMVGLEHALNYPNPERSHLLWKYLIPYRQCIRGFVEQSKRKTYENAKQEERISAFGKKLIETAWLPDGAGRLHKPTELRLGDLPDNFDKFSSSARILAERLGMQKTEEQQALATLAKGDERKTRLVESLLRADDALLDQLEKLFPKQKVTSDFKSFKAGMIANHRAQKEKEENEEEKTLSDGVKNAKRYQSKLDEITRTAINQFKVSPQTIRFGVVRRTTFTTEARTFLYNQYRGECQITNRTFPMATGNNYFETVSLVSKLDAEYLNNPGNMLCLSAEIAAKFMHASFEWLDDIETKIQQFRTEKDGGSLKNRQMHIILSGKESIITWTEQHFMRLISLWKCGG